jgi:hypothetical protein
MLTVYISGERAFTIRMAVSDTYDEDEQHVRLAQASVRWQEDVLDTEGHTEEAWRRLHLKVTGKHPIRGCGVDFMISVMRDHIQKMGYPLVQSGLLQQD